jgi:hypothetical protein
LSPLPLVVIIGNFKTVRSTQYKNGRERAVKKPLQQEGVAILTEDSERRRNSHGGKKHNNRETNDGRVPKLKGFIGDLKDAGISSGNRKVCQCTSNGVKTLVSAR